MAKKHILICPVHDKPATYSFHVRVEGEKRFEVYTNGRATVTPRPETLGPAPITVRCGLCGRQHKNPFADSRSGGSRRSR